MADTTTTQLIDAFLKDFQSIIRLILASGSSGGLSPVESGQTLQWFVSLPTASKLQWTADRNCWFRSCNVLAGGTPTYVLSTDNTASTAIFQATAAGRFNDILAASNASAVNILNARTYIPVGTVVTLRNDGAATNDWLVLFEF